MQYKNGGIDGNDKIACSRILSGWPEDKSVIKFIRNIAEIHNILIK